MGKSAWLVQGYSYTHILSGSESFLLAVVNL
jgi:hypothetical protein